MSFIKISELPSIDLSVIHPSTQFAFEHPCDRTLNKTTGGEIFKELLKRIPDENSGRLYGFNKLTAQDRYNLCDIAWFLKGMKTHPDFPFTDQIESLEKAILAIGDKVRHDDKK